MRTILFICTGNTCRSPMAEAIARHVLDNGGLGEDAGDVFVASAGVATAAGSRTSNNAVEALRRKGIDFSGRATALSAEMIRNADFVLCMTEAHGQVARDLIRGEAEHEKKILLIDPAGNIDDPIGMGLDAYDRIAERLLDILPGRLREILHRLP